jgi:hypothetical protein
MNEKVAMVALVQPISRKIAHLSSEGRITLLCALLAQEICCLPPAEREPELRSVLRCLPSIFLATEKTMREALADNARREHGQ